MIAILIWASGLVMTAAAWFAWRRYHDPLHPLLFLTPMFVYLHTVVPIVLLDRGMLTNLFTDTEKLLFAQAMVFFEMTALAAGAVVVRLPAGPLAPVRFVLHISPLAIRRLRNAAFVLGGLGLAAFFYRLSTIGGFIQAYSRPKGGGAEPGLSGYITGASLLTIPAIFLLVLSHRDKKPNWKLAFWMFAFAFPHLAQGLLGGSRGNAFLAVATLALGWYLTRATRPSLRALLAGLLVTALLMFTLKTHRRSVYLGSESIQFDWNKVVEAIVPKEIEPEHVSTLTLATIIAARDRQHCFWGRRYLAQLVVRPIPRQIWPTKYDDLGFGWMVKQPGSGGMHPSQWIASLGWFPAAGSAVGLIADAYLELSWGSVLICFFIGWLYASLWRNAVCKHGLWTLLYFEACAVSVYVPTQGLATAWLYRFAYLAVPSIFLWWLFFNRQVRLLRLRSAPPKIVNGILRAMHAEIIPPPAPRPPPVSNH
jgi:hypothetical protein